MAVMVEATIDNTTDLNNSKRDAEEPDVAQTFSLTSTTTLDESSSSSEEAILAQLDDSSDQENDDENAAVLSYSRSDKDEFPPSPRSTLPEEEEEELRDDANIASDLSSNQTTLPPSTPLVVPLVEGITKEEFKTLIETAPSSPTKSQSQSSSLNNSSSSLGEKLDLLTQKWTNQKLSSPVSPTKKSQTDNLLSPMQRNEIMEFGSSRTDSGNTLDDSGNFEEGYKRTDSIDFSSDLSSSSSESSTDSGIWREVSADECDYYDLFGYHEREEEEEEEEEDGNESEDSELMFSKLCDHYEEEVDVEEDVEEDREVWQMRRMDEDLFMPTIEEESEESSFEDGDEEVLEENISQAQHEESNTEEEITCIVPAGELTAENGDEEKGRMPLVPTLSEEEAHETCASTPCEDEKKGELEEQFASMSLEPKMTQKEEPEPISPHETKQRENAPRSLPTTPPPSSSIQEKTTKSSLPKKKHTKKSSSKPASSSATSSTRTNQFKRKKSSKKASKKRLESPPPPNDRYLKPKKKKSKHRKLTRPIRKIGKLVKKSLLVTTGNCGSSTASC